MDLRSLDEVQLDALREVANIGAGHAATALSELTKRLILVDIPEVRVVRLEEVGALVGDPAEIVAAVIVRVEGGVTGRTLQLLPATTAARLTGMMLGGEDPEFPSGFGASQRRALEQVGSILVQAYLNALGQFVGLPLQISGPAVTIDMAAAVLTTSYLNFGTEADHVFCVNTRLGVDRIGDLPAHFLLIPDEDALGAILRSLGIG